MVHTYGRTEHSLSKESLQLLAEYYINFFVTRIVSGLKSYTRLDGEWVHYLRLIKACLDSELQQEVKALTAIMTDDFWCNIEKCQEYLKQLKVTPEELVIRAEERGGSININEDYEAFNKFSEVLTKVSEIKEYCEQNIKIIEVIGVPDKDEYREGVALVRVKWQEARSSPRRKGVSALWNWLRGKRQEA